MSLNLLEALSKPKIVVGGRASAKKERAIQPVVAEKPRYEGRDYVREYQMAEESSYQKSHARLPHEEERRGGRMSDVDTLTNPVSELTMDDARKKLNVYDDYSFDKKNQNLSLPILEKKDEILKKVNAYRVIIVKGATGCGKTTQVPQFILDQHKNTRQHCNIVVTQPRRIAAISVAKRICLERDWKLGTVVGYQIGQHKEVSDNTVITFCTTGVLLQKIVKQKTLAEFTHIILDEVHERDAEMDFLLILVRKYANTNSRNVKVILMSATINTDTFSEYFFVMYGGEKQSAPVVAASERNTHNVRVFYLDDLQIIPESGSMIPEHDSPDITKKGYTVAVKIIIAIYELERVTAEKKKTKIGPGAVLVFVPGLFEIEEMKKHLEEFSSETYKWWIVPLHSSITTEEQDKVFHNPPENYRKIVLSTNIAESSITVPDIRYVIDFGLTKVVVTDPQTNLASLQLSWTSKNSMIQRAGRAGRVSEGRVYRLIEKRFYDDLEEETTPEILRCPLDQLVLKTKLLDAGPPKQIFALAMNQPDLRNIEQTVLSLKEIGALSVAKVSTESETNRGTPGPHFILEDLDGDLTELGSVIAKLPMDVRLGKLIFFGDLFNVLDECIIMACAMSVKNMFSSPFQAYLKAYNSKLSWASSSCSDCIAYVNAYTVWRQKKTENAFRGKNAEADWCRSRFLQVKILREIAHLHNDVRLRLRSDLDRAISEEGGSRQKLNFHEKNLFVKLALAAAFYPNYFLRGSHSGKVDEQQAVATLGGKDPYCTVYLQGMPVQQPGILYKKTIEKLFEEVSSRVNINFDHGSKILISFGHYANENALRGDRQKMLIPGKIDLAVYRALKMRQLKSEIRIPVLNVAEADKRVKYHLERYEQIKPARAFRPMLLEFPWDKTLDTHRLGMVELRITNVESPIRFWARSPSRLVSQQYQEICEFLNGPGGVKTIEEDEDIKIGNVYAYNLNFEGRSTYFRCRIESYKHYNETYNISFIDIGDGKMGVKRDDIRAISHVKQNHYDKIPDLATEFSLVKIQPLNKYDSKWSEKAIQYLDKFKRNIDHKKVLIGEIYSVVGNVAKVKLYYCFENQQNSLKNTISINKQLVKYGLAEKSDEPFLSKQDHLERKKSTESFETGEESGSYCAPKPQSEKEKLIEKLSSLDLDEPSREDCRHEVVLKGPFSPLEMRIFSATKCSVAKLPIIERNSVNSVLLDTNPSDEHERMVIASFVGISPSRDKLSLRDTTVLPSLPGLPALICLFFSPMVEMRCDPEFTRFTGALCGLGYEKGTKRALNGDKDMEITFDVEITLDTLIKVNKVRFWLNRFLAPEKHQSRMTPAERKEGYNKLRSFISELVWQEWKSEEMFYITDAYKWGRLDVEKLMNPCQDALREQKEPADDYTDVYRLIWGIDLDGDVNIRKEMVRKNLKLLEDFIAGKLYNKDVECKLCQITLPNRTNARIHVKSTLHKVRAMRYLESNDENYDSRSEVTEG